MFNCIRCGLCCKNIHLVDELKNFHNGDGICRYLDLQTNLCNIYHNRPDICNVEKSYEKIFYKKYTKEEYINMNYKGCKVLWKMEKEKKEKL